MKIPFEAGRKFKLIYPDMDTIGEYGRCVIRKRYMSLGSGLFHAFEMTEGVIVSMENITDYFIVELIDTCMHCKYANDCNVMHSAIDQYNEYSETFTCANFKKKE